MKRLITLLIIVTVIVAFTGCYYDKAELVYAPTGICDTTNVTYTSTITSIISNQCSGCHTGAVTSGFPLTSYQVVKTKANLILTRVTSTGTDRMPQPPNPRLPDCEIAKIKAWVNKGAP